ncbi:RelA/SpoT domain-containing protein [Alloscardovia venturai]|uniref:RelA/SpoT domain-containing protein n=1 Tax=Alloscardovia venturai TaxID=1769421 RepID=A0ABW2Y560_9BIFI
MVDLSRSQMKKSSKVLKSCKRIEDIDTESIEYQNAVIWRGKHLAPLFEVFRMVNEAVASIEGIVVTMRLKRMKSILSKLLREDKEYDISTMEDIGGCRVICEDIESMRRCFDCVKSAFGKEIKVRDYVTKPKGSGYRCVHIIVKHQWEDRNYHFEIQIRTRLQHIWATGIENIGVLYGEDFKSPGSNANREHYIDPIMMCLSSIFALEERSAVIDGYTTDYRELCQRLNKSLENAQAHGFDLIKDLQAGAEGFTLLPSNFGKDPYILLLCVDSQNQVGKFIDFGQDSLEQALDKYGQIEVAYTGTKYEGTNHSEQGSWDNAVLVAASDFSDISKIYPNYTISTQELLQKLNEYSSHK